MISRALVALVDYPAVADERFVVEYCAAIRTHADVVEEMVRPCFELEW